MAFLEPDAEAKAWAIQQAREGKPVIINPATDFTPAFIGGGLVVLVVALVMILKRSPLNRRNQPHG